MPGYKSSRSHYKHWISLDNPSEINYWKNKFHCSAEELIRATSVAGCSVYALEKFLVGKQGY